MVLREVALREALVEALRTMAAGGLVSGTEGNPSARAGGGLIAISPSALAYETIRPEDVCLVTPEGELVEGPTPSVELPMHLAVLAARPDVGEPAPSGTPELGAAVLAAVGDGDAVVIQGHGPVCFGPDLAAALARAFALEEEARSSMYAP